MLYSISVKITKLVPILIVYINNYYCYNNYLSNNSSYNIIKLNTFITVTFIKILISLRYCSNNNNNNNNKHNKGDSSHIITSKDNSGSYFYSIYFTYLYILISKIS